MVREMKPEGKVVKRALRLGVGLVLAGLLGCGTQENPSSTIASGGSVGSGGAGGGDAPATGGNSGSGGGGAGGSGGGGEEAVLPQGTSVFLEVRQPDGTRIPGAEVIVAEPGKLPLVVYTNALGTVLFENLEPGRFVAQVHATGFTEASAVVPLQSGMHVGTVVVLHPFKQALPIDSDVDSIVEQDGVQVSIPAGSLVDLAGNPVVGAAAVTIVPLDPTNGGLQGMPGPLMGITTLDGPPVSLESVFMADVSIWQDGERLQLADGARATLTFEIPDALEQKYGPGTIIPAWSFHVASGQWRNEGDGVVQSSPMGADKLAWTMDVGHFSWWNADYPAEMYCYIVTLLNGNGTPAQGAQVISSGVDYQRDLSAWTGADGTACVTVKRNSTAIIFPGSPGAPSGMTVTVTSPDLQRTCDGASGACEVLTPIATQWVCTPGSSLDCNYPPQYANNLGIGPCVDGIQYCKADGSGFDPCFGEILPQMTDDCSTPIDDDCDGITNEPPCAIVCAYSANQALNATQPCGVGVCSGVQACLPGGGAWGPCMGPTPYWNELCYGPNWLPQDDYDCDGTSNALTSSMPPGECLCYDWTWEKCYPTGVASVVHDPDDPNDPNVTSKCKFGVRSCEQNWGSQGPGANWGDCFGFVLPDGVEICGNGIDDNCNGAVDELGTDCCNNATDCEQGPCKTAVCNSGECDYTIVASGLAPNPEIGNCKDEICQAGGSFVLITNDQDLPVDNNPCTHDVCDGGAASNPNKAAETPCIDGVLNGMCNDYGTCVQCIGNEDCQAITGGACVNEACEPPSCSDGIPNGGEKGPDCGAVCPQGCGTGTPCDVVINAAAPDCASSVCAAANCPVNVTTCCQAPTCTDDFKNGDETDLNCGNTAQSGCSPCAVGKSCVVDGDCSNGNCVGGSCANSCANGSCGGSFCPGCLGGVACSMNSDCQSGNCAGNLCTCSIPGNVPCANGMTCNAGTCPP